MSVILASGGYDRKIRFWEAPSGLCTRVLKFPDSQINKLEIAPDKQFVAAAGNPLIRIYEVEDGAENQQPALTLEGHAGNVTSIGFQRDGRYLYSGSEDGTIKVWDLRNPTYSRSFDCKAPVNSVALRLDRDEIISGDASGNVKVWDLGGNSHGCTTEVHPGEPGALPTSIQSVDVSEDSKRLVAATNHGHVFVWDPSKSNPNAKNKKEALLTPVTNFRAHPLGSYCLHARLAPDCRHLCTTGSDGYAKLWDTTTWELAHNLRQKKWVWDAAFCDDSSYLVTASSDHTARLWNLRTGEVVRQYNGHQAVVSCVALNDSSL